VGPKNHVLDESQYRTNPFAAARVDKLAMRPFAKLLWTLVWHYLHFTKWATGTDEI